MFEFVVEIYLALGVTVIVILLVEAAIANRRARHDRRIEGALYRTNNQAIRLTGGAVLSVAVADRPTPCDRYLGLLPCEGSTKLGTCGRCKNAGILP